MLTKSEFSGMGHALCVMHLIHEMSLNAFQRALRVKLEWFTNRRQFPVKLSKLFCSRSFSGMFKALQFLCSQETEKWKKDSKSQFPGRNGLCFFFLHATDF